LKFSIYVHLLCYSKFSLITYLHTRTSFFHADNSLSILFFAHKKHSRILCFSSCNFFLNATFYTVLFSFQFQPDDTAISVRKNVMHTIITDRIAQETLASSTRSREIVKLDLTFILISHTSRTLVQLAIFSFF